jgi:hypothetical protein
MLNYDKIYEEVYIAFQKAIEQTGDAYKNLSWFARNKPKGKKYGKVLKKKY